MDSSGVEVRFVVHRASGLTNRAYAAWCGAAIKTDPFPFKRPPRHDSFMRWLGSRSVRRPFRNP